MSAISLIDIVPPRVMQVFDVLESQIVAGGPPFTSVGPFTFIDPDTTMSLFAFNVAFLHLHSEP